MYAEKFILNTCKTYYPEEKAVPHSQLLFKPSIYDKLFQLIDSQRFREDAGRHYPPPLNPPTPNHLTPSNVMPISPKRNLSALTNFSRDGDDESEKK